MPTDTPEAETVKTTGKEKPETSYYESVGRRRVATARVRLYVVKEGGVKVGETDVAKGAMVVNGRPVENYFPGEVYKKMYQEPFRTTNTMNRFAVSIKVRGGGLAGQLGAVILGISRALEKVDREKFRPILKKRGFMMRDPRAKERRKAGNAGKARARKQSPKR
ncbi:30S ribosomal protein S9 [Candidatus Gottesmanbacteria bacterium]|nr:30S ribosomal protein S9 [Candidatus Gottesmanbacteria bacterium]